MAATIQCHLRIPFMSAQESEIAYNSLRVDKEPTRGGVKKTLTRTDKVLHAHFEAFEARHLRVSVGGFFDHIMLVMQTLEQFGPPLSEESV